MEVHSLLIGSVNECAVRKESNGTVLRVQRVKVIQRLLKVERYGHEVDQSNPEKVKNDVLHEQEKQWIPRAKESKF